MVLRLVRCRLSRLGRSAAHMESSSSGDLANKAAEDDAGGGGLGVLVYRSPGSTGYSQRESLVARRLELSLLRFFDGLLMNLAS